MRINVDVFQSQYKKYVYGFNLFGLNAVFVQYTIEEKPKGKRLWKVTGIWDKYDSRRGALTEPELTPDIRRQCLEEVTKLISVNNWAEWRPNEN